VFWTRSTKLKKIIAFGLTRQGAHHQSPEFKACTITTKPATRFLSWYKDLLKHRDFLAMFSWCQLVCLPDLTMSITADVLRDRGSFLTLSENLGIPPCFFVGFQVAHVYSFLCCGLLLLCLVSNAARVSGVPKSSWPLRVSLTFIYILLLSKSEAHNFIYPNSYCL
jgi:hypothetical protein